MGSLGGGGRYDNLTSIFGLNGVSGVGISLRADRIYDVMQESGSLANILGGTRKGIIFMVLGRAESQARFDFMQQCRAAAIPVDVYPDPCPPSQAESSLLRTSRSLF